MTLIESLIGRLLGVVPAIELKVSQQETKALRQRMADVQAELDYIKGQLSHTHLGEWKVTKDGTKRYRKVATRFIATKWTTVSMANYNGAAMSVTESEAINAGLPCDGEIKEIKEPDYVLEDRASRNPFYAAARWDKMEA